MFNYIPPLKPHSRDSEVCEAPSAQKHPCRATRLTKARKPVLSETHLKHTSLGRRGQLADVRRTCSPVPEVCEPIAPGGPGSRVSADLDTHKLPDGLEECP